MRQQSCEWLSSLQIAERSEPSACRADFLACHVHRLSSFECLSLFRRSCVTTSSLHAVLLQSYLNAAARTDASLIKFPPVILTKSVKSAPSPDTDPLLSAHQAGVSNATEARPDSMQQIHGSDGAPDTSQNKRRKTEEASAAAAAIETALVDDDIDWTAFTDTPEVPLVSTPPGSQQADAIRDVSTDLNSDVAQPQQAEAAALQDSRPQQVDKEEEQPPGNGAHGSKQEVQHAVAEYIKALLDPFYKAGIVNRDVSPAADVVFCIHMPSMSDMSIVKCMLMTILPINIQIESIMIESYLSHVLSCIIVSVWAAKQRSSCCT